MKSLNHRNAMSQVTTYLIKKMRKMKSMGHRRILKRRIMRWSSHLNIITSREKIIARRIKSLVMMVKYKGLLLMAKRKWFFRMELEGRHLLMAILLFISIITTSSRPILTRRSFIILLKLRLLRQHSLMDCRSSNFLIVRLRSISLMELKR